MAIKKRSELQASKTQAQLLEASKSKISKKLQNQVDDYTALNDVLKLELPKLHKLTNTMGIICLTRLINLQEEWYSVWTGVLKDFLPLAEHHKDLSSIVDVFSRESKYILTEVSQLSIINGEPNLFSERESATTSLKQDGHFTFTPVTSSSSKSVIGLSPRPDSGTKLKPYSVLFHSALPEGDQEDQEDQEDREDLEDLEDENGTHLEERFKVLYLAASIFEFNISSTKLEFGYPYLTYQGGEVNNSRNPRCLKSYC